MIKRLVLLSFLFIVLILSSCADKTITTQYETGEKYEEYQYTGDSLKHGWYKSYSPGGILIEESNYVDGKLEGLRKIYTANGELEITELYTMDVLNGVFKNLSSEWECKARRRIY